MIRFRISAALARAAGLALLGAAFASPLASQTALGPKDGLGLAPTDTGRVTVGMVAPDFTLEALHGPPVTLSELRGSPGVLPGPLVTLLRPTAR